MRKNIKLKIRWKILSEVRKLTLPEYFFVISRDRTGQNSNKDVPKKKNAWSCISFGKLGLEKYAFSFLKQIAHIAK